MTARSDTSSTRTRRHELTADIAGASLLGVPLLFTMETWWIGQRMQLLPLLALFAATVVVCAMLARMAKAAAPASEDGYSVLERTIDSLVAGTVVALVGLVAIGQFRPGDPVGMLLGTAVVLLVPLGVGAAVSGLLFVESGDEESDQDGPGSYRAEAGAAAVGALFIGLPMAPTEEIPMLAAAIEGTHGTLLAIATIAATYAIVHASGFDPAHPRSAHPGLVGRPIGETVLSYGIAIAVSVLLLLAFGQYQAGQEFGSMALETLVLATPAAIGAAAGRIVL